MNNELQDNHLSLPKRTTPTWEVELLISGASVFALMQFPGWLNSHFHSIHIAIGNNQISSLINPLFLYAKGAAFALIITLFAHIILRAYWVSLIGLHSIFPQGLDHDKLRIGPIQKRVIEQNHGRMEDTIERADNRSTLVFAIGIGFAMTILAPSILVFIGALSAWLAWLVFESERSATLVFLVTVSVPLLIFMLPLWIDAKVGTKFEKWPRLHRILENTIHFIDTMGFSWKGNMLAAYFYTLQRNRYVALAIMLIGLTITLLATALTLPRFSKIPTASAKSVSLNVSHYRDQQNGNLAYALRPSIQSETINGDYLALNVPYPLKMPPSTIPNCAQKHFPKGLKRCLTENIHLKLDNKPIQAVWFEEPAYYGQPATLRAMIDLRKIDSGSHTLVITYPQDKQRPERTWQEQIVFWN